MQFETASGQFIVNELGCQELNCELPVGGNAFSGHDRFYGVEGFELLSLKKSIMRKFAHIGFPFNLVYPNHTPSYAKALRMITLGIRATNTQVVTRCVIFAKLVILLYLILTRRFSFETVKKYQSRFAILATLYGWALIYIRHK